MALDAGLMLLPVAAAMLSKKLITKLIIRYGYRCVLLVNTVLVGSMMASFALTGMSQPLWLRLLQLAVFGAVNSMQYTTMDTLPLKELGSRGTSSGNSLFSLVQMLSISLGVTIAGAVLSAFTERLAHDVVSNTLPAFHATFFLRWIDYRRNRLDLYADNTGCLRYT